MHHFHFGRHHHHRAESAPDTRPEEIHAASTTSPEAVAAAAEPGVPVVAETHHLRYVRHRKPSGLFRRPQYHSYEFDRPTWTHPELAPHLTEPVISRTTTVSSSGTPSAHKPTERENPSTRSLHESSRVTTVTTERRVGSPTSIATGESRRRGVEAPHERLDSAATAPASFQRPGTVRRSYSYEHETEERREYRATAGGHPPVLPAREWVPQHYNEPRGAQEMPDAEWRSRLVDEVPVDRLGAMSMGTGYEERSYRRREPAYELESPRHSRDSTEYETLGPRRHEIAEPRSGYGTSQGGYRPATSGSTSRNTGNPIRRRSSSSSSSSSDGSYMARRPTSRSTAQGAAVPTVSTTSKSRGYYDEETPRPTSSSNAAARAYEENPMIRPAAESSTAATSAERGRSGVFY